MEARSTRPGWPERGWSHPGHFPRIRRASGVIATTSYVRSSAMPGLHLLHMFIRNFSRSLFAHAIQPLPPEFLEATPLAASRKAGEKARFWKSRFPQKLPWEKLGRWIRSPPNPRGSDLADPNDHSQATAGRDQASRTPPAGLPTRLRPRTAILPGGTRPANSAPGESRRSRGTPHAQEDAAGALRQKPEPVGATQGSRRY